MIRIGKHVGLANLPFITLTTFFLALIPAALLIAPIEQLGAGEWSWVVALLGAWVAFDAFFVIGFGIVYGTVQWDPDHRVARLRGREVPVDTVTEAWRNVSGSTGRARYLIYRFVSTAGPSVRVLVAAKPFKGLDAIGLQNLYRFVAALPLQVPDHATPGMPSDEQRALAVTLMGTGGSTRSGKELLLEELASMIGARSVDNGFDPRLVNGATTNRGERAELDVITPTELQSLEERWKADDAQAAATLAAYDSSSRRWRRRFFWLLIGALGAAAAGLVIAIVNGQSDGRLLEPTVTARLPFVIACAVLVGVGFSFAWSAAADRDVRERRRLALASLEPRDDRARLRGLAPAYWRAWTEPSRRVASALWFVAAAPAFFLTVSGLALIGREVAGIVMLLSGLALATGAVFISVWIYRRRRADAEQLVQLAGWRMMPPESVSVDRRPDRAG